jgi:hypothetical protein
MSNNNTRIALIAAAALTAAPFAFTATAQAEELRVRVTEADLASDAAITARATTIAARYCDYERRLDARARCEANVRTETVAKMGAYRDQRLAALAAKSGGGVGSVQTATFR